MAITKQTAKRSTGGKAPRAEIARKAARVPRTARSASRARAEAHQWIMYTGGAATQWMVQPENERLPPFPFANADRDIPSQVEAWCRANPGVALDTARCERWGLLFEGADDAARSSKHDDDDDDEEKDDDEEDDKEDDDEDDDDADDDADTDDDDENPVDKGGSNGASSEDKSMEDRKSRSGKGAALRVKRIKYESAGTCYKGCGDDGRWFPLVFWMLRVQDEDAENMKQLRKFDEWCTENPDMAMQLPVGWRPGAAGGGAEFTEVPILYRSNTMNCVLMAAANAVGRCDSRTAELLSRCDTVFNSLRKFAVWFNKHTSWRTVDVFRALESTSSCRPSPRSVMEHILLCDRGVYIVQPIDEDGNSPHAIAINCFNRTIHDCAEEFAMVLSIDSLSQCCGAGNKCIGFLAAYRLEMKAKKHSRNHRSTK
jgi:hypothetical protein